MADWNTNPSWTSSENINNGDQYTPDDVLDPEDLNRMIENMQYLYERGGDFEVNPYPIGSIYISTNSVSPASLFGGTWSRLEDKFLLAAGTSFNAGSTGGSATHKLTISELPSHSHTIHYSAYGSSSGWNEGYLLTGTTKADDKAQDGRFVYSTAVGGGSSFSTMPPYITVYMWERIS